MNIAYFDTSALLKQYVTETGTVWVNELFSSPQPPIWLITIAQAENLPFINPNHQTKEM